MGFTTREVKVERRNTEHGSASTSIGKSNNVCGNSYFRLNIIEVLFTDCRQYGQISTDVLSDLHANSEKQQKGEARLQTAGG